MCDRCAELEERVAWLESELGLQRDETARDTLRSAILAALPGPGRHGQLGTTNFVMALYAARGRVVTRLQVLEAVPPRSGGDDDRDPHIVDVWAVSARQALGRDAIATVWGQGYRLTAAGVAKVAAILEPGCSTGAVAA